MSETNDALGVKSNTHPRTEERPSGKAKEKASEDDVLVRDSRERHWFWMDNDLFTPVIVNGQETTFATELGASAVTIYSYLCRCADKNTQQCDPGSTTIVCRTGISKPVVAKSKRKLEKYGLIERTVRTLRSGGRDNDLYTLLNRTNWDISGDLKSSEELEKSGVVGKLKNESNNELAPAPIAVPSCEGKESLQGGKDDGIAEGAVNKMNHPYKDSLPSLKIKKIDYPCKDSVLSMYKDEQDLIQQHQHSKQQDNAQARVGVVGDLNSSTLSAPPSLLIPSIMSSIDKSIVDKLIAFGMTPDIAHHQVENSGGELCLAWLEYAQVQRSPVGPGFIVSKVRTGDFPPGYVTIAQHAAQQMERQNREEAVRNNQEAAAVAQRNAEEAELHEMAELDALWQSLTPEEKQIIDDQVKRRLGPFSGRSNLNNGAVSAMRRNILRRELGYEGYEDAA